MAGLMGALAVAGAAAAQHAFAGDPSKMQFILVASRFALLQATVLVGVATLIQQWHRPSDVIAAMIVVCFWGCAAGFVLAGMPAAVAHMPYRVSLGVLGVVAALLAAIAVIGLGVTAAGTAEGFSFLLVAYVGAVSAIGAVGFGLAWLGNRMFAWLR